MTQTNRRGANEQDAYVENPTKYITLSYIYEQKAFYASGNILMRPRIFCEVSQSEVFKVPRNFNCLLKTTIVQK